MVHKKSYNMPKLGKKNPRMVQRTQINEPESRYVD